MPIRPSSAALLMACGAATAAALPTLSTSASAATALPSISPVVIASANASASPAQSLPDDIAALGGDLFVTYQNGVGPDGAAAASGNTMSTVVDYSPTGQVLHSWNLTGRCDGLGADPATGKVIATVNEDLNSYLAVLTPSDPTPATYSYSPSPAEGSPAAGGTDSVSVAPDGTIYIAHSNPGTPSSAATYVATLSGSTASLAPLFADDATATDAVSGQAVTLALTDPDSNRLVPSTAPVLAGDLLQDSQGDGQVVVVEHPGTPSQDLRRLVLSNAENTTQPTIDDLEEITGPGTLYAVDQAAGTVSAIDTANFAPGTLVVSQPSDSGNTGQLGVLDPATGVITHFANTFSSPKGLVFVAAPSAALPESPLAVALPAAGLAVGGAALIALRRRRSQRDCR